MTISPWGPRVVLVGLETPTGLGDGQKISPAHGDGNGNGFAIFSWGWVWAGKTRWVSSPLPSIQSCMLLWCLVQCQQSQAAAHGGSLTECWFLQRNVANVCSSRSTRDSIE